MVSQQADELVQLAVTICAQIGVDGPYSKEQLVKINPYCNSVFGRWVVSNDKIFDFLYDQGSFVREMLEKLDDSVRHTVISEIGEFIVNIVDGILQIQTERDFKNQPGDDLPPILSHQLIKLCGREFGDIISTHHDHLIQFWDEELISQIEHQYNKLRLAYQFESSLKAALDTCDHDTTFETGWSIVKNRFDILKDFCGGIAIIFPNTATVEADFSALNWAKDDNRMSLTDISLEDIMQCKQFELLSSLV